MADTGDTKDNLWLGDSSDWSLVPVIDWLVTQGRKITVPTELVQQLGHQLRQANAPVWSLRFGLETVDPQVLLWGFGWEAGQDQPIEVRIAHDIRKTNAYIGSPVQKVHQSGNAVRQRLHDLDPEHHHEVYFDWQAKGCTDYLILPMFFHTGHYNTFILVTQKASGFSDSDITKFTRLVDFLSPTLEVLTNQRIANSLLDTYVGPRTGSRILQGSVKRGDGEVINAALWFSDLRNFTHYTETLPSDQLLAMLNAYFETIDNAVSARGGEILHFIGDAMMIIFTAEDDQQTACQAALDAAIDAIDSMAVLNHQRQRKQQPLIRFGIGLHVGEVIYGNIGSQKRLDFTVVGPAANRVARLEKS